VCIYFIYNAVSILHITHIILYKYEYWIPMTDGGYENEVVKNIAKTSSRRENIVVVFPSHSVFIA